MIVACDPGIEGAFALYDWKSGRLEVVRMPTSQRLVAGKRLRRIIDEGELLSTLQAFSAMGATAMFIEAVSGMPGQSAPAAFTFGQGYGAVRMAALSCGMSIEAVPAALWKQALKVPRDKRAARARASEMIPTHKHLWSMAKDDGLAEASMLAIYGHKWITGGVKRSQADLDDIESARQQRARTEAAKQERIKARGERTHEERQRKPVE